MKRKGRPLKTGLVYFPLAVNIFTSRKMQRLFQAHKQDGVLTYIALLCNIYGKNGYFVPFTANLCFDLSFMLQIEEATVHSIINFCVEIDLFDKTLFLQEQILTSSGIQSRYLDICKRPDASLGSYAVASSSFSNKPDSDTVVGLTETAFPPPKTTLSVKKSAVSAVKTPVKEDKIDYNAILMTFNSIFSNKLPHIVSLSNKRKELVKQCIDAYGFLSVEKMLQQTLHSPFLLGENDYKWCASFDWLFQPDNYIKVLEGNYIKQVKNETIATIDPASHERKAGIREMAARAIANDRHP